MKAPLIPAAAMLAVAELPDLQTVMQFGALGVLALYFLYIEPRKARAEREARKCEIETAHKHRVEELRLIISALKPSALKPGGTT